MSRPGTLDGMRSILHAAAGLLARAEISESDATVRGYAGEQLITFALKLSEEGSITKQWTEACAPAPEGLVLWIRPARRAYDPLFDRILLKWEIKKGITVRHLAGDPRFDAAFLVEGAPRQVVRELFSDEEIRKGLLELSVAYDRPDIRHGEGPLYLEPMLSASEGRLSIHLPRWIEDAEQASLLVRTTVRLAALGAEIVRRGQAGSDQGDTSDYRGQAAQERRMRDEQEVRDLRLSIARRGAWRRRQLIRGYLAGSAALIVYVAGVLTFLYLTGEWRPWQ